ATIEKVDLRVPFTVGVNLRTVAARLHRAPRARLVLRRVEERPAAVLRAAGLQAPPRPVRHAGRYLGEDAADRTGHAARRGLQARALLVEAHAEPRAPSGAVEHCCCAGDIGLDLVVCPEEGAQRLA